MNEQQLAAVKQALEALMVFRYAPPAQRPLVIKAISDLQSIISQDAIDKMAKNASELGLDYESAVPLTERDLASACLSYRHDFGLMDETNRGLLMFQAREWARAFGLSITAAPEKGQP